MKILGKIIKGRLALSDYNRRTWNDYLKKPDNEGKVICIEDRIPESQEYRKWFEGALIPLITYYQDGLDHNSSEDNKKVRDWILSEFNSEGLNIKGKIHLIRKTSKGKLNELTEKILDWMVENGYDTDVLQTEAYKKWRDEVFSFGECESYIDYLVMTNKLKK
jgi:hypothetical protein